MELSSSCVTFASDCFVSERLASKVHAPKRSPDPKGRDSLRRDTSKLPWHQLGSAALLIPVRALFSFVLALAALFLLPGLPALLSTLTALLLTLLSLARLVAGLSGLALLSVLFHIVCH
jgi:hypothetical protein